MKTWCKNILILMLPFLIMILVNENSRINRNDKGYSLKGVTAINSARQMTEKCSWSCYNNTSYCKQNHVRFMKPYFDVIDPIYFGMIDFLKNTGNYQLANILILVVFWPLLMFFVLVKSLKQNSQIRLLKKQRRR